MVSEGGQEPMGNPNQLMTLFTRMVDSRKTMLGVGPMSVRIVEEAVTLANELELPIALIPSRRQIECEELGGGYVNNWTTQSFSRFVRKLDKKGFVFLSRDHSGPWQFNPVNEVGRKLSHEEAMIEVKQSLDVDIKSGFDILHIDPSPGLENGRDEHNVIEDIAELIDFCCGCKGNSDVIFEVGADEQSMVPDLPSKAEDKLNRITSLLIQAKLPKPLFYVLQTGTKVKELRNIGSFATHVPVRDMLSPAFQIPEILDLCRKFGVYLKEHNADYLPIESLKWHRIFGIHSANVAPEFGVEETRAIISIAREYKQDWFIDDFGNRVLNGGKWRKWLIDNSESSDSEKILMAGHYHYAEPEVQNNLEKLTYEVAQNAGDLEKAVRNQIRISIKKYLLNFGYYG